MKLFIVALVCVSAISAYEILQDEEGQNYFLVPIQHRQRRQTNVGVSGSGSGVRVTAGHKGNILNNNGHRLDGGGFVSKQFRPSGPATVGGQLGYSHGPSGSNVNIGAQHTQRFGTDVSASARGNIWKNKNVRLDAVGSYDRHFGGLGGTGKPNAYGGLQLNGRF